MDKETVTEIAPIEVTLKEKPKEKEPNFDYDDYSPTEEEILQCEKEIHEKKAKETPK